MDSNSPCQQYELLTAIVSFGQGSKILRHAKQNGILGGTIFLGKGTIKNPILEFLELAEIRKEIVLMAADTETAYLALSALNQKFDFAKPNHGIAFSTSITSILGTKSYMKEGINESRGVTETMYNLIMVIVDKGNAESVIDAAKKAGSKGGTIINGRGSGIHETNKLFAMEIEPEKEIVLIIAENALTEVIATSIKTELRIDEPGKGIIFIQDINNVYGLY